MVRWNSVTLVAQALLILFCMLMALTKHCDYPRIVCVAVETL